MIPEISELYQEVILDHNRRPRHFRALPEANAQAHGHNPLCGDDYRVYLDVRDGRILAVGFEGSGCAISKSSASMMMSLVDGRDAAEAVRLKEAFLDFLLKEDPAAELRARVGPLKVFEGVRKFPVRVKCATLAWRALEEALAHVPLTPAEPAHKEVAMSSQPVEIQAEVTPNPNTLKFNVNRTFLESGSLNYTDRERARESRLARELFGVESVLGVMIGRSFVTVTKAPAARWETLVETLVAKIRSLVASGEELFPRAVSPTAGSASDDTIAAKVREILDNEIRPAVAMDGGDIVFHGYENGVVTLHLQGSCSSCPSAILTLKMGVENRLKSLIPEVREVVQV